MSALPNPSSSRPRIDGRFPVLGRGVGWAVGIASASFLGIWWFAPAAPEPLLIGLGSGLLAGGTVMMWWGVRAARLVTDTDPNG